MNITEQNTSEIRRGEEISLISGVTDTSDTVFNQYSIIYFEHTIGEIMSNFENTKTKYPKEEENLSIKTKMDLISFAESLFPEIRLFNKEEQEIFKKVRNKIFKEL